MAFRFAECGAASLWVQWRFRFIFLSAIPSTSGLDSLDAMPLQMSRRFFLLVGKVIGSVFLWSTAVV